MPAAGAMGAGTWLASALAGAFSRSIVHPLDTVRAVQMVSGGRLPLSGALRSIVRADGVRGLYRGFGASLLLQAPAVSVYLSVYEFSRDRLRAARPDAPPFAAHVAAGFAAEAVSALIWAPMEVVKQRAQCRPRAGGGSRVVLADLLRREGPRALLSGYLITIAVFGPYASIYFVVYERCREEARQRGLADAAGPVVSASAATAGAIAAASTTPLDVVKTRLQTQGDAQAAKGRQIYTGALDAVKTIARTEGLSAFFKGVTARCLWIMPSTAITMSTFEFLKPFLGEGKQADKNDHQSVT